MALQKVEIVNVDTGSSIKCMYNPEKIQLTRRSKWQSKPISQKDEPENTYAGGGGTTLTVELFFDTTRDLPDLGVQAKMDVRSNYIDFLSSLMDIPEGQKSNQDAKPPYCDFKWGGHVYLEKGFLKSLDVTYSLFLPDGTPIRARANLSIEKENDEVAGQNPTTRSIARKTWVVRGEERLDWIAYQEYGNSAHWRHIAETNDLDNPFELHSGQVLRLVPLP